MSEKCRTCICKYEYKTTGPCKYCKHNSNHYWGREESKMIQDNHVYVGNDDVSDIPY